MMIILSPTFEALDKSDIKIVRILHHAKGKARVYLFKWKEQFGVKVCLPENILIIHISEIVFLALFCLLIIDDNIQAEKVVSQNLSVYISSSIATFYHMNMEIFQCSRSHLKFVLFASRSCYKNDLIKNSITLKSIQKPVRMCTEIVNNLTILHNEIQNSKIVFQRWKNICTRKCYLVKYNSDSAAEVNLYKVCNESCVSFDTYTMICLFNLSLIAYFEGKEGYRRTEQLRNFESHL